MMSRSSQPHRRSCPAVPPPQKNLRRKTDGRDPRPEPASAPATKPPAAHPAEPGWLPDYVYTGEKFEAGLAFFADALGRITRFSREPADLAIARRLPGQAALPGLISGHSIAWHRVLRGRTEQPPRSDADPLAPWREAHGRVVAKLTPDDMFGSARMAFLEMMLAGVTCVGEFHVLHQAAVGATRAEPHAIARGVLRAAHEVGIRIALLNVAATRGGFGQPRGSAPAGFGVESVDAFVRATEALRGEISGAYAADEAWLGVAAESLGAVPIDDLAAIAAYAHAQRMRLHARVSVSAEENTTCAAEHGRTAVTLLAERGIVDKRFTAVHGGALTDEECRLLGAARATVCVCPTTEHNFGLPLAPIDGLLAAGAAVALGTGSQMQADLLKDARLLEYALRTTQRRRPAFTDDAARGLWHAATVAGARSLGATGGALEVGRPADFFTVNLYDPSVAGANAETLLASVVLALERRAIREVWIGARQRIVGGRHPNQGLIVGKFVEAQNRLWVP